MAKKKTKNTLLSTARSLVNLQTQPVLSALDRQAATLKSEGSALQGRAVSDYGNTSSAIRSILEANRTNNQASQARLTGIADTTRGAISGGYQQAQDRLAQDATVRGMGLDGGASRRLADEAATANARAAADAQASQAQNQQVGNSYQGLLASMMASAQTRGQEASGQIGYQTSKALKEVSDKRTDTLAQRGPLLAKTYQDLAQQEFSNYATQVGLNLKSDKQANDYRLALQRLSQDQSQFDETMDLNEAKLGETTRHNQATESTAERRIDATLRGQTLAHQDRLAKLARSGGLTPAQRLSLQRANGKIRSAIRSGVSMLGYYRTAKNKDGDNYSPDQIKAAMMQRFGNDADIVAAAYELRRQGHVSNATEEKLRSRGIGVPERWVYRSRAPVGARMGGNRP